MSSFDTNFSSLDYSPRQSAAQHRLTVRMCACAFVCVFVFMRDVIGVSRLRVFSDWSCEGPSPSEFALIPPWIKLELWANPLLRSLPLLLCGAEGGFNPSGLRCKLGESGREAADRLQRQQKNQQPQSSCSLQHVLPPLAG